ncbi:heme exporter protein CcmD [Thermomonas brevis]|jgi:heme exporter protein D|uniref:Heme exporter protein D n=1 Tax=Thermomonas brevis TaxID=215691 RepID=A0A7G9QU90_9GAMM|nr:heme exporter protein CcmD [Thermomonas brevis]QNN46915.1 heme exporter protein CcmD [Thermomonas brevis]
MSYRDYVIAAYAVFALMLLWDWLVPKLQIRAALRAAKLRNARRQAAPSQNPELPLSRD